MMRNFIFKYLISIALITVIFGFQPAFAKQKTFVSISPAMTEIMYALSADNLLMAVSDVCSYPEDAAKKPKIGSGYAVNEELIVKMKPDYILAPDSSEFLLQRLKRFNVKPICFKYPDIASIQENILKLGELTDRKDVAKSLVDFTNEKIKNANKGHNKKILYLVQSRPMITIGAGSFITDEINKSGNISATGALKKQYPIISEEYAIRTAPDIVVLGPYCDEKRVKKLFPEAKIVRVNPEYNDIINRPGPRIYKGVEFFAEL